MLWFKPTGGTNWNSKTQYAFQFQGSLQCYFTQMGTLMCDSTQMCDKLMVDTNTVSQNEWAHITVQGLPSYGSILQLETNSGMIDYDHKGYVTLQQSDPTWKACLGGCNSLFNFIGGFRDFVFLSKFVTMETATKLKNHYLFWDANLIAYYRFTEKDFMKDQFKNNYAKVTGVYGEAVAASNVQARDFIPNDICYPITDMQLFYGFTVTGGAYSFQVDSKWSPLEVGWEYSMSVWLKIDAQTCSTPRPSDAQANCFIAMLDYVFMLYMPSPNQMAIYFFNPKPYYQILSNSIFVPQGAWVNVQLSISQYNGYEMRTYDILGRMMSIVSDRTPLYSQIIQNKNLALFKNYQGLVKNLLLLSQKSTLPIQTPSVNLSKNFYYNNPSCIAYFIFTSGNTVAINTYSNGFVNFCRQGSNSMNVVTSSAPTAYQGFYSVDLPYNSGKTLGLISSNQTLFDGIACNDGNKVDAFTGANAYAKVTTPYINFTQTNQSTVEFWFKALNPVGSTNYLFSAWAISKAKEYLAIYYDATAQKLLCMPFGFESVSSPYIAYIDYTDAIRQQYGWLHVVCQVNTTSVLGSLYKYTFEKSYSSNNSIKAYVPSDSFEFIVGNNRDLSKGTQQLLVRELRVWGYMRSYDEITSWRYVQVDPRLYTAIQLLTYLRFDEASFDDFNFASIINPNLSSKVATSGITYMATDPQDLLICPINTYFTADFSRCYQDPIIQTIPAVWLQADSNGSLSWIFDASIVSLTNKKFKEQIFITWTFEDPVIMQIAASLKQTHQLQMKLPAKAFRDEGYYGVRLNYTNTDVTFNRIEDFTFVPKTCQHYIINNNSSNGVFNNYTNQTSTENITFTIDPRLDDTQCLNSSFFNAFAMDQISYQISPSLVNSIYLQFSLLSNKSIQVTLPKTEQFKLPIKTELTFVLSLPYTSSIYSSYLNSYQLDYLTFQQVVYKLYLNSAGQTVMPYLFVNKQTLMKEDNAFFDASASYISGVDYSQAQQNLTYSWICPSGLEGLCLNQTTPTLNLSLASFLSAGGKFNQSLTFTVQILWSHTVNAQETTDTFTASQTVIWQNITVPEFSVQMPSSVKSTVANQQFKVVFNNQDITSLGNLSIQWSFVPNLTVSTLNLTQNNTVLTVPAGGFQPLATYALTISVQNLNQDLAKSRHNVTFMTSTPPFGGTVSYTPTVGYVGDTNFTVTLSNWQTANPPVQFQIWATSNPGGTVQSSQISQDWINANTTFTFKTINTNPLLVIITDKGGEIVTKSIMPTVTVSPQFSPTNLLAMISSPEQSISDKYSYMNTLVSFLGTIGQSQNFTTNTTTGNSSQEAADIAYQISARTSLIDQVTKDLQTISLQKSIDNGDSQAIIINAVSLISQMSKQSVYLNDYIVSNSITALVTIQNCTALFPQLLQANDNFKTNFFSGLSNLIKYSTTSSSSSGRLLSTSSSGMTSQLLAIKADLVKTLCQQITPDSLQQTINTDAFEIVIEKFSPQGAAQIQLRSYLYNGDDRSRVNVRVNTLVNKLQSMAVNFVSACVQATFYKQPYSVYPSQRPASLTGYSQAQIEFQVVDSSSSALDLKPYVDTYFEIHGVSSFNTNQTMCMGYSGVQSKWTESLCSTNLDAYNLQVQCSCTMLDTLSFALFTDSLRTPGQELTPQQSAITDNSGKNSSSIIVQAASLMLSGDKSLSFLAVLLVLALFALVIPATAYVFDKRDHKTILAHAEKLTEYDVNLLKKLTKLSGMPTGYWMFKYEDVISYSIHSKSMFAHLFSQIHPFISIFTKFDVAVSRISRFSVYFLQVSLFALICVMVFGASYRAGDSERLENVLDMLDINAIILIGCSGMLILLPLPVSCLRKNELVQKDSNLSLNKVDSNRGQHHSQEAVRNININLQDNSNGGQVLPPQMTSHSHSRSLALPDQLAMLDNAIIAKQSSQRPLGDDYVLKPKCQGLLYAIAATAYLLCFAAIAMCVVNAIQAPVSNQYCTVASFYIGLFGSMFLSNVLRVAFNSFLVSRVMKIKDSPSKFCCANGLKWFLAEDTLQIAKEIEWVAKAEKKLLEKEAQGKKLSKGISDAIDEAKEGKVPSMVEVPNDDGGIIGENVNSLNASHASSALREVTEHDDKSAAIMMNNLRHMQEIDGDNAIFRHGNPLSQIQTPIKNTDEQLQSPDESGCNEIPIRQLSSHLRASQVKQQQQLSASEYASKSRYSYLGGSQRRIEVVDQEHSSD